MRTLNVLFLLLAATNFCGAQWSWQNPLPQGNRLYDIDFTDSLRGWAVGVAGTVVRTTDAGQHWFSSQASKHEPLIRVSFVNPQRGWLMTYSTYKILRTTDGGATWDSISTLPSPYFLDMLFLNDSIGFASGSNGRIVRSTNGGVTWSLTQTNFTGDIVDVHFADDLAGWAAASAGYQALRTTNGGLTWNPISTAGLDPASRSVFSLSSQRAYIVGSHDFMGTITGFLYSTANGGATWQERYFDQSLSDVYFASPSAGWVSDINGLVYQTTNGGTTWTPLGARSSRFTFVGARHSWGITGTGVIFATDDGWQTYSTQTHAVTTDLLEAVSACDSNHAVACGANQLIVGTSDGGRSWSQYHHLNSAISLVDILHKSVSEIWAVGQGGHLVHSTDGGTSWTDTTLQSVWLSGIAFASERIGYIISSSGTIYRTDDAGKTWVVHTTLGNTPLDRIIFSNPLLGWVAADNGIHRSIDGGLTWQQVYSSGASLDIAAAGNRAWFSRVNTVTFTTDVGSSWTTRTLYPLESNIEQIRSLAFADENNGWAVSDHGHIYHSTRRGHLVPRIGQERKSALWRSVCR